MKNKIIKLIRLLGFGINELMINIELTIGNFDSIEWDDINDKVYLHIFKDDLDIELDFDELSEEDQLTIYKLLSIIYN